MSRTLATLAEIRDRVLWGRERLDFDLVVRVLDDGDGHWECLADELIIEHRRASDHTHCDTMRTVLIQLTAEQVRMYATCQLLIERLITYLTIFRSDSTDLVVFGDEHWCDSFDSLTIHGYEVLWWFSGQFSEVAHPIDPL